MGSFLWHCSNRFQVNMFISRFMIKILHNIQNVQEGKMHQKKRDIKILCFQICVVTNLSVPSCFCLCSYCCWILNDIGRNSLLGNRKKINKFLMRTFICLSTFLYGQNPLRNLLGGEVCRTHKKTLFNHSMVHIIFWDSSPISCMSFEINNNNNTLLVYLFQYREMTSS